MKDVAKLQKNLYYRTIYMMFLISITIATIIFLPLYLELKRDKYKEFYFSNQLKQATIAEYFKELKAITLQITTRTKAREILINFNNKKISLLEAKKQIEYILSDALNLSNAIVGILRFNFDWNLVANVGISLPNNLKNIFKDKINFFAIEKIENSINIIVSMPIIDRSNKIVGYDIVIFDTIYLQKIINNYSSQELKSYIGYMKNYDFVSIFDENINFNLKGIKDIKDFNLKELNNLIIQIDQIKDTNLSFLIKYEKDKFYSIINNQVIRLIIVSILILIIGVIGIYLLSKPILARLKREMEKQQEYQLHLENMVKKEIEKRLKQEQLLIQQSKILSMAEMMSAIAHQWRQPLNVIGLIAQDVNFKFQDKKLLQKDMDKMEKIIMKEVGFLSNTIDKFSNFFKPSTKRELFNIIESILNIIDLTFEQFRENSISYRLYLDKKELNLSQKREELIKNSVLTLGYPKEFEQAILNIVLNSKDAIESQFNKRVIKEGKIVVDIITTNQKVTISIIDNGGGIKEEIIDKIFEPYFTTKFSFQGVGVGLYMVKMLIEKGMNGKISVSNDNFGAKFILELDLYSKI